MRRTFCRIGHSIASNSVTIRNKISRYIKADTSMLENCSYRFNISLYSKFKANIPLQI